MNMDCPQCKSAAQVTRVSAMYYDCEVVSRSSDYLPSDWQTWPRYHLVPSDAKALAKRLAPPRKPSDDSGEATYAAVEAGGFFAEAGPIGIIIAMLSIILLPFAIFISLFRETGSYSDDRWHAAMDRWDTMLYCAHCESVFIPGQDNVVSSKQMAKLLYRLLSVPPLLRLAY